MKVLVAMRNPLPDALKDEIRAIFDGISDVVFLEDVSDKSSLRDVEAVLFFEFKGVVDKLLPYLENARVFQTITAGTDHIPTDSLPNGAVVLSGSGATAHWIAEHVFALMLAAAKKVVYHTVAMRNGEFHQEAFSKPLAGATLGIVGLGHIGCEVAKRARCFDMKIMGLNRSGRGKCDADFVGRIFDRADFEKVLKEADFLLISVPLTPETRGLIGEKELKLMKKDAVLVNVARGKVIDLEALYKHLSENKEFTAALDVWWKYPRRGEKFAQPFPIEQLPNVVMTPHLAPKVPGFFEQMVRFSAMKLREYLEKERV